VAAAAGVLGFLRSSPVFAGLPAGDLASLAAVARREQVGARQYIFSEGDPARWFCLVVAGRVKIVRQSRTGKEVVVEILGPGEPFGGVAVLERRPYPASAQATEPSVVVKIPQDAVILMAERHPSIMREMALMIGRRLRAAHDAVKSLAIDPAEARLAATVLRLADGGSALPFHVTRQTLADMSGTTVETAIRIMSRWQRAGIVQEEGGRLTLADPEAVQALAEGAAPAC
jgi:CRP/FNR family transcriptional regulator